MLIAEQNETKHRAQNMKVSLYCVTASENEAQQIPGTAETHCKRVNIFGWWQDVKMLWAL